ncbi:hypothetical protein FBUS_07214 [Fasciolopsis buskii]|uniref:Uncharacterized protein n=1 Tax=Fasciolopsis buskii TaxID=27845 RepID=A0A8E0VHY1_9TREM|nr:hypothetical protein FBUS_07214 [Fasciolopsis buski]
MLAAEQLDNGTSYSLYFLRLSTLPRRSLALCDPIHELRAATMKILSAALQPRASNVRIQWNLKSSDGSGHLVPLDIVPVPQSVPPIFSGHFATVFGLFDYSKS